MVSRDINRDRIEDVWRGVRERSKEREIRRSAIKCFILKEGGWQEG